MKTTKSKIIGFRPTPR
jgi:hypothetical protein